MDAKEMFFRFVKTIGTSPGKIFFFIVILSFSIAPTAPAPSSSPFKTELHEKITQRVSRAAYPYQTVPDQRKVAIQPSYSLVLTALHLRTLHRLKIFKKETSDFHSRNGLHLRLPSTIDSPYRLV